MRIVARPFKKFFNIEENRYTPTNNYSVWEKMDGSLGILFYYDGEWIISTKGSFESTQAISAGGLLRNKYSKPLSSIDKRYTYLFEIIIPGNRIVVDYGDSEQLFLLGVIETSTSREINLSDYATRYVYEDMGFDVVDCYNDSLQGSKSYMALKDIVKDDKEGFIVLFTNGDRIKIKGDEYIRLHKIVSNISNLSIWESLKKGIPSEYIVKDIPDEFYSKIDECIDGFHEIYRNIELRCLLEYYTILSYIDILGDDNLKYLNGLFKDNNICIGDIDSLWDRDSIDIDRKTFSMYAKLFKTPSILYKMLDGRDYSDIIWDSIRPNYSKL
jgi:RNA ligase